MPIVHDEQASTRSHSKSVLDRSFVSILPHPDDTPSRRRRRRHCEEEVAENNTTVDRVTKIHKNNNNNNDEDNDTADDDDVTVEEERLHRLHGTSLIRSSCQLLRLSTCCFGTACTLFHRYFHAISLREMDVWSVAMASVVIASKITPLPFHQTTTTTTTTQIEENDDDDAKVGGGNENNNNSSSGEGVLTLHQVILVFAHLYRKRRMIYIPPPNKNDDDDQQVVSDDQQDKNNKKSTTAAAVVVVVDAGILPIISEIVQHPSLRNAVAPEAYWSWKKKQQYLKDGIPPMSTLGPVWKEWYNAVTNAEHKILRQLGFTLYWIPTHLPHYYLASFCSTILRQSSLSSSSSSSKQHNIQTRAWNYCNDSFLLDFCVRYPPNQVACAALYLACLEVWLNNDDNDNDDKNNNKNNNDSKDAHYIIIEWLEFWSDWPERLCGANANEIATLSNALLGLTTTTTTSHCSSTNNHNHNDHNNNNNKADLDRQVAFYAFVPPLFRDSFNGPYSFLWDMANDSAHNENQSSKSKNMNNNNNNT